MKRISVKIIETLESVQGTFCLHNDDRTIRMFD